MIATTIKTAITTTTTTTTTNDTKKKKKTFTPSLHFHKPFCSGSARRPPLQRAWRGGRDGDTRETGGRWNFVTRTSYPDKFKTHQLERLRGPGPARRRTKSQLASPSGIPGVSVRAPNLHPPQTAENLRPFIISSGWAVFEALRELQRAYRRNIFVSTVMTQTRPPQCLASCSRRRKWLSEGGVAWD
ncbi:hypothetical protein E2C01_057797 [Portunus trituberculatus]|uniref:Uncharacterized protein n=1 Tax=Portunus trituberculatus TaxID=210409 RepID=A0A5B7H235_PORTR|nr:hypothetical protein [Portunus trituberculatus]